MMKRSHPSLLRRFRRTVIRFTAALLSTVMCVDPLLADASQASVWKERRAATPTVLAALPTSPLLNLSPASRVSLTALPARVTEGLPFSGMLAPELGRVSRVVDGTGRRRAPVLFIQDVHGSIEAQKNIRAAVESLLNQPSQPTLALEGAFGPIDLRRYRNNTHRDVISASAEFLFSELEISGPARAALTANEGEIRGIDDAALHRRNVEAYLAASKLCGEKKKAVSAATATLEEEKLSTFSPDLLAFDRVVTDFRAGRSSLSAYAEALAPFDHDGALRSFREAARLETTIDFHQAEAGRAKLLERLVARASAAEIKILANDAVALRLGTLTPSSFYGAFCGLCGAHGIALSESPAFETYARYVSIAESIDGGKLWSAFSAIEKKAYGSLARTSAESDLVLRSRAAILAGKLTDFALTPEEWADWKTGLNRLSPTDLTAFEEFYRAAELRDGAMAANADKMPDLPMILVAGGFHARGLADALAASGRPVVVWTPAVKVADAGTTAKALGVFARETTPLEVLFQGQKLFLADQPFRGLAKLPALGSALSPSPQEFVDELLPGSGTTARVVNDGEISHVELQRDDRVAETDVRHRGLKILGEKPGQPLRLRGWTGRAYQSMAKSSIAASALFAAGVGAVQEFAQRILLGGLAGVTAIGLTMLGASTAALFVLPALIFAHTVYFATADHPYGRFLGEISARRLTMQHRLALALVAATLGIIQIELFDPSTATLAALTVTSGVLGLIHSVFSLALAAFGGPFAMARQSLDPNRIDRLLAARDELVPGLRKLSPEKLIAASAAFRGNAAIGELTDDKIALGIALLSVAVERAIADGRTNEEISAYVGGPPSRRQIEAALALLDRRSITGMRPSEGKTLTVVLASFLQVSLGKRVEVHDWNSTLTARDAQVSGAVLSRLGLRVSALVGARLTQFDPEVSRGRDYPHLATVVVNGGIEAKRNAIREIYAQSDVVYGPYDTMIYHWMDDWFGLTNGRLHPTPQPDWVLVEESDTPLLDAIGDPLILARRVYTLNKQREQMYRIVYKFAEELVQDRYFVVELTRVRFRSRKKLAELVTALDQRLEAANIRGLRAMLDEQGTRELLLAALEARYLFRKNFDYFVIDHRIVIRNTTTGEVKRDQRWARGIHTFIEIKESKAESIPIQNPTVSDVTMTALSFYNQLWNWSGVAGVLDQRTKTELRENYNTSIVDFPPVHESRLDIRPPQYFRTESEKLAAIVAQVVQLHASGRPILINAASPEEATELGTRLRAELGTTSENVVNVVDGRDESRDAVVWSRMGVRGAVTVAAQVASRGHEIKIPDELYEPVDVPGFGSVGGLIVIGTHHAALERLEAQVRTRAGRRGRLGVYLQFDHAEGNPLLTINSPDELRALLAVPGQPDPVVFRAAIDVARDNRSAETARRQAWFESRYNLLILTHGQFSELARGMIEHGQEAQRFFNLSSDILNRANVAIQLGDGSAYYAQILRMREEIRYMANVLKVPGLAFASNLPFNVRLRLLRRATGLKMSEVATGAGIPAGTYSRAENRPNTPRVRILRRLENFFVESRGLNHSAVRQALGQTDPAVFLKAVAGLPRHEVLRALRASRWMTEEEMGELPHPAVTRDTISDWENGITVPTDDQTRQMVLHFIEHEGFPYKTTLHAVGIRSNDEVLKGLDDLPMSSVLAGLRGGRSTQDVADGVGEVTTAAVRAWEKGSRPRDTVLRRIVDFYARQGFNRDRVRKLLGLRIASEVEAEFPGKSRIEVMELARKAVPLDQKEWAALLNLSVTTVNGWNRGKPVPVKAVRDAAAQLSPYGFRTENFLRAAGIPDTTAALAALEGKSLNEVIVGIREITGEEPQDVYTKIHATDSAYKGWERNVHPPRQFRVRLAGHWGIHWKIPQETLRRLLNIPQPTELLASLRGKPLSEVLALLESPYDYTDNSLAGQIGAASSTLSRYKTGAVAADEILENIATYFHDTHRLPQDEFLAILRAANAIHGTTPTAAPGEIIPDTTVNPDAPATEGDATGVIPFLWGSLHRWALHADDANQTRWRLTSVVSAIGAAEEWIFRPLLGLLVLFLVPAFGLDPLTTHIAATIFFALAFATLFHPTGYVGREGESRGLSLGQRERLFALALLLGAIQFSPLPFWIAYPLLGLLHAAFNFWAVTHNGVLGMSMVPDDQILAEAIIRSENPDRGQLLAAIDYIGHHPGTSDLELLNLAMENHPGDETIGLAVINAMLMIRRTSVPFYRKLQNESMNGIIWHALSDAGVSSDNFTLVEDPDGKFKDLRFAFPVGQTFDRINEVISRIKQLYIQKNRYLSGRVEVGLDPVGPAGRFGWIRIYLPITTASLTDYQRGFGMLDFSVSPANELLPLLSEELAAKLEENAWTFLRGMDESDPRRQMLVDTLYGKGTPENPGVLSALRQLDKLGDKEIIQVESTSRPEPTDTVPRNKLEVSLNQVWKMAKYLPYFTRFIPEKGIDHIAYFARGTGSHFSAAYLKGLMRGRVEDDFMIYVSRDTLGLAVYKPISEKLAALYGIIAKNRNGENGRVENFTIYRLAATQWLRRLYYETDPIRLPNGRTGYVVYRKSRATHDNDGRLREVLAVYDHPTGGTLIAEIERVTKAFDFREDEMGFFNEEKMVDNAPEVPKATWVEGGMRRPFEPELRDQVAASLPAFKNRNRIIYAVRAVGTQMANSPFLQNLRPAIEKDAPVVGLVEETALGSAAILTAFAIEEETHREERDSDVSPELALFRKREPDAITVKEGERWEELERQNRAERLIARSVEVKLFLGKARDFDAAPPLPGFPELNIEEIMRVFGMTREEAIEMRAATTRGSEKVPQPYAVDWANFPGQPALGEVPIRLESPLVRALAYLKELMIYNGVVRYYRRAYVTRVATPLLQLIGNPDTAQVLRKAALEALPEFPFSEGIRQTVKLATFRTDLNAELDDVAQAMFERNLEQALSFDGGKVQSVERFEALQDKKALIDELASDKNPLLGLRQKAIAARALLDQAARQITVLGMEFLEYSSLSDAQRVDLRRNGYYPFPLMSFGMPNEFAELERQRAVYGVGPARLATHTEIMELLTSIAEAKKNSTTKTAAFSLARVMDVAVFPVGEEILRFLLAAGFGAGFGALVLFPIFHTALHLRMDATQHGAAGALARIPLRLGLSTAFGLVFLLVPMIFGLDPLGTSALLAAIAAHAANNLVASAYVSRLPSWLKPFSIVMSIRTREPAPSPEIKIAGALVAAMSPDAATRREETARALNAALQGSETPIGVIESPFDTLTAKTRAGELDTERLGSEIARQWETSRGSHLSEHSAFQLMLNVHMNSVRTSAETPTLSVPSGQTGTLWVMNDSNAEQADNVIRQSLVEGARNRLIIVVTDASLMVKARSAAVAHPDVELILDDRRVLTGESGAQMLSLTALEGIAVQSWGSDFWNSSHLRVLAPPVPVDLRGLSADSRMRTAVFMILDALGAVPISVDALENMAKLATVIGRQA